jgi:hypothetical protein
MTTTVIVQAHCASDKEVRVLIRDKKTGDESAKFTLQDGQTAERVVYDNREIVISEVLK